MISFHSLDVRCTSVMENNTLIKEIPNNLRTLETIKTSVIQRVTVEQQKNKLKLNEKLHVEVVQLLIILNKDAK